jgi:thiol-disulfide isomerase/thioredoxin
VAKKPASKKNVAASRRGNLASDRTTVRPVKPVAAGPAGLFTWLAIGLVIVMVATFVIIKVVSGTPSTKGDHAFSPVDPRIFAELTTVPVSVFNTVGVNSSDVQVSPPIGVKGQPPLRARTGAGTTAPEVFYLGAEYCPYCAAQRWPTIIALSRFGTWANLGNMSSYAHDKYPNIPTFTFVKSKFTSKYIVFKSIEEYTNYLNFAKSYYATLQKPSRAELELVKKYDTPKFIPNLTKSDGNPIPFITMDNKFLLSGASYAPDVLSSLTRANIASGLSDPTSPVTIAIIASANYQTAAICSLTNDRPTNVCTSLGVLTAKKAMKIK